MQYARVGVRVISDSFEDGRSRLDEVPKSMLKTDVYRF